MKLTLLRQNIVRGSVISVLLAVKIASGRDLPPIHFGRADGVERTLLRIACQSETFLAPPWQDDANIRFLWHIGCQSDFDELVSMASRPVYRGSCRRRCFSTSFYPVKSHFGRMGTLPMMFHPVKGGFGRMGRVSTQFRPPKRLFRRMGNIFSREQLQKIPTKSL